MADGGYGVLRRATACYGVPADSAVAGSVHEQDGSACATEIENGDRAALDGHTDSEIHRKTPVDLSRPSEGIARRIVLCQRHVRSSVSDGCVGRLTASSWWVSPHTEAVTLAAYAVSSR